MDVAIPTVCINFQKVGGAAWVIFREKGKVQGEQKAQLFLDHSHAHSIEESPSINHQPKKPIMLFSRYMGFFRVTCLNESVQSNSLVTK